MCHVRAGESRSRSLLAAALAGLVAAGAAGCREEGAGGGVRERASAEPAPEAVGPATRGDGLGVYAEVVRRLRFEADLPRPESYSLASTPPLGFPSGRAVAADGVMLLRGAPPFAREVPAGRCPVDVLLGRYVLADGRRWDEVLVAGIRFSAAPVVRWVGAGPEEGRGARTMAEVSCYPIDSATGGLFDAAAFEAFGARYYGGGRAGREIVDLLGSRDEPVTGLDSPAGGGAVFSAGGSDGCYASVFGLDAEGRAALLLTDLTGVLDVPLSDSTP